MLFVTVRELGVEITRLLHHIAVKELVKYGLLF